MMTGMALGAREVVVRRLGVISVGRIYGAIMAAVGLLIGFFFALASLVGAGLAAREGSGALGALFGVGAIVLFPLLYGAMGFVGGVMGAAFYNLFAGMVGGVSVELEG
jgi:hypothetical protein